MSSLYVEAVEKKPGAAKTKHFHGDATKVVASGNGLKKGFPGRPCTFNLESKDAGKSVGHSHAVYFEKASIVFVRINFRR